MEYLLFVAGFFLVIYGANFLVDGAAAFAKQFRVSNLVIGLTVVAFGTSAPELVVTVLSSTSGNNDIAFGNVVGSNILNILLILGVSSLVYPLTVHKNTVWKEIPFALLSAVLIFVLSSDYFIDGERIDSLTHAAGTGFTGAITRIDGFVLLSFFIVFLYYAFATARNLEANGAYTDGEEIEQLPPAKSALYLFAGLIGLALGGRWIVNGAIALSAILGLSQKFVGLTVVALGTSLPELATSLVAARKRQTDIAIGNVVGSNIFNTFFILGTGAFLNPIPVNAAGQWDTLVNIGASILLFGLLFVGRRHTIGRYEGVVFLVAYISYTAFLLLRE